MPWAYYPDLRENFNGFYSKNNMYGRPGRVFMVLAFIATVFYIIPRVWAKRWNMLVCGIIVAYSIKTFIVFSSCYHGICPEKLAGLWLVPGAALLMMIMALVPDLKVKKD